MSCVRTRPLEPADGELMRGLFARMSPDTRYLRFASPKPRLTRREATYLMAVDHHDHEAVVALACETGEAVGVARYVRLPGRPEAAEIAVTVADAWQGQGLGPRLARRIIERATAEGVVVLRAEALAENGRARRLLGRLGFVPVGYANGMVAYERHLEPALAA